MSSPYFPSLIFHSICLPLNPTYSRLIFRNIEIHKVNSLHFLVKWILKEPYLLHAKQGIVIQRWTRLNFHPKDSQSNSEDGKKINTRWWVLYKTYVVRKNRRGIVECMVKEATAQFSLATNTNDACSVLGAGGIVSDPKIPTVHGRHKQKYTSIESNQCWDTEAQCILRARSRCL